MEVDEQAEMKAAIEYGKHSGGAAVNMYAFTKALEVYEANRNKHTYAPAMTHADEALASIENAIHYSCTSGDSHGMGTTAQEAFENCLRDYSTGRSSLCVHSNYSGPAENCPKHGTQNSLPPGLGSILHNVPPLDDDTSKTTDKA